MVTCPQVKPDLLHAVFKETKCVRLSSTNLTLGTISMAFARKSIPVLLTMIQLKSLFEIKYGTMKG